MSESSARPDVEALRSHLHGESIGRDGTLYCDFCDVAIPIDEPVTCDVVRDHNLRSIESRFSLPDAWVSNAARCAACDVTEIDPPTDGWEEAIVRIGVRDANGVLSLDASTLTVVDYSPSDEGEYPPLVPLSMGHQGGFSLSRWAFVRSFLENVEDDEPTLEPYRMTLAAIDERNE